MYLNSALKEICIHNEVKPNGLYNIVNIQRDFKHNNILTNIYQNNNTYIFADSNVAKG